MAAPRAISSGVISFGLVSIPVKVFTATSPQNVRFNQLHASCGSRIKQQLYCPVDEEVVDRKDLVKGYEFVKNQYVRFTDEELKKLETERSSMIDIVEFVPLDTVDLIHVEKSYYLGPDKGGSKAYLLLSGSMERTGKIAVGRWRTRGKEQLVLIRPYKEGLLLHQVYYADEVRDFDDIVVDEDVSFKPGEPDLADQLIDQLASGRFNASQYKDEYRARVLAAVEEKAAGHEITVAPEQPAAEILDLFEALKASLGDDKGKAKAKGPKRARGERPKPVKKVSTSRETKAKKKKKTGSSK